MLPGHSQVINSFFNHDDKSKHYDDSCEERQTYQFCASHSLNLIGKSAVESCSGPLKLFDFVQNFYVLIWSVFINSVADTQLRSIKRGTGTQWSSRADAVSALKINYLCINIKEALNQISISKKKSRLQSWKRNNYEQNLKNRNSIIDCVMGQDTNDVKHKKNKI